MTWIGWIEAVTLLAIASTITYVVGYVLGVGKGFKEGWLMCRKQTDPNVNGGWSEHPSIRKARQQRLRDEALKEMWTAKKHDREHWN